MVGLALRTDRETLISLSKDGQLTRLHVAIHGAVQGVGFRPFIYRLAKEMRLNGWVLNSSQGVFIEVEGHVQEIETFLHRVDCEKPPRAFIQGMETSFLDPSGFTSFEIRESESSGEKSAFVLPDVATCPECASEIHDPANRRYHYPFTNCTNCGPRFSIIRSLPYDRPNTTMARFLMCDECRTEYEDPTNRRFHAQPNACPKCGPHIELWNEAGAVVSRDYGAIVETAVAIRSGKIVALKGIGGFQLLADARNDEAVRRLRSRKHREEKPFALMYPAIAQIRSDCQVDGLEERLLASPEAPIVLLRRRDVDEVNEWRRGKVASGAVEVGMKENTGIAPSVAPNNPYMGVMLPYTPLHLILMNELGFPVVATSGNISDEPICIDEHDALEKLGGIADLFLVHDRPIERQVDDSVVRVMAGRPQIVRRARGYAPFPVEIPLETGDSGPAAVLAVGGHLKNTVAINSGANAFVSQHIGDLSTAKAYEAFEKVTADLQRLYDVRPRLVAHDLHPDYLSAKYAARLEKRKFGIQHHFAHVASCMADNQLTGDVLGVSWDGTGFGTDGTIWGGEFFVTDALSYDRVASFRKFRLPGGNASVKEPRRTAIGLLYELIGEDALMMEQLAPVSAFDVTSRNLIRKMLESKLNSPITTSAGRLFDAVASLIGIRQVVNFEGQAAMELEFAADGVECTESYHFAVNHPNERAERPANRKNAETRCANIDLPSYVIDWEPMMKQILADVSEGVSVGQVSAKFHNTLSDVIVDVAGRVGAERVVLSGGCFQNKYLTERAVERLTAAGFRAYWHQRVPPNDGGLSLGQMYVALQSVSIGIEGDAFGRKFELEDEKQGKDGGRKEG